MVGLGWVFTKGRLDCGCCWWRSIHKQINQSIITSIIMSKISNYWKWVTLLPNGPPLGDYSAQKRAKGRGERVAMLLTMCWNDESLSNKVKIKWNLIKLQKWLRMTKEDIEEEERRNEGSGVWTNVWKKRFLSKQSSILEGFGGF